MGRDSWETHTIQILDKLGQILAFQAQNAVLILASAKKVTELVVKLERSSVEVVEWLQGIGWVHEGIWARITACRVEGMGCSLLTGKQCIRRPVRSSRHMNGKRQITLPIR